MKSLSHQKSIGFLSKLEGRFLGWSGTEEELQEFLKDTGIMAFEYVLTGKSINER